MSRRVHFVGIGGAGLSAIARVLHERGEVVSGSDKAMSNYSKDLESLGIPIRYEHQAENVENVDLVIVSSAIPADNAELVRAQALGIPVVWRETFLPGLLQGKDVIAVAGTHGKTTTTGLIAWLLSSIGKDPSFIVGGILKDFGLNAHSGEGSEFVIEADEYDRTFLGLEPKIALITNVEYDHPDCYPSEQDFQGAFQAFSNLVMETLVICSDDPGASALQPRHANRWTYGLDENAEWRAEEVRMNQAGGSDFLFTHHGESFGLMRIRLPGLHNILNSVGALVVLRAIGIEPTEVQGALAEFRGIGRRFDVLGEAQDVLVVDDYAHHPTEIRATLAAARRRYADQEIWAVFQPHTFTRMRALAPELAQSFRDADHVLVLEVFAAREELDPEFSGARVANLIEHPDVRFIETIGEAVDLLEQNLDPGSVVITLSAGDGNLVGTNLLARLGFGAEVETHG